MLALLGVALLDAVGPGRAVASERAGAYSAEAAPATAWRAASPTAAVPQAAAAQVGTIAGRVTEASSGVGVAGATVLLEGTSFGAVTGNTGRYEISDVPAGSYTLVAQQPGYRDARSSVTVADEQVATVDVALEVSALPMDEIVATGTAFSARVRTLPNPISVITAREIEQKQSTNVTDLLRGEIPGLMALSGGQDDETSQIFVRGNASGTSVDIIKVYIDGVEVAHPTLLSTIDPKSIERIEVVRGPAGVGDLRLGGGERSAPDLYEEGDAGPHAPSTGASGVGRRGGERLPAVGGGPAAHARLFARGERRRRFLLIPRRGQLCNGR